MNLPFEPARQDRRAVAGLPAGYDALWLVRAAAEAGAAGLLHVTADRERLRRLAAAARFFAGDVEVLVLPPWDCAPYDRLSPSAAVSAERVATLSRLLNPGSAPRLVLTSPMALLRRLPRRGDLEAAMRRLRVGDALEEEEFEDYLLDAGYVPAEALAGPGDFLRQSNDDRVALWPPGFTGPVHLELRGGTLGGIERDGSAVAEVGIAPLSELVLRQETARCFLKSYGALFGAEAETADPLPRAVAAGRRHAGMEHWLPLFLEGTETLFDWMPAAALTIDETVDDAREDRLSQIAEAYEGRRRMDAMADRGGLPVYRPIPPIQAFLTAEEWDRALDERPLRVLRPSPPEPGEEDAGGRAGPDLSGSPEDLAHHVAAQQAAGWPVVLAAARDGQRATLVRRLGARPPLARAFDPAEPVSIAVLPLVRGFTAPDLAVVAAADLSPRREEEAGGAALAAAFDVPLRLGDLVVHADHGVGLCDGIEAVDAGDAPHACIRLIYRDNDRLLVPVESLDLLWRFGAATEKAPLDRLGGVAWRNRLARTIGDLIQAADTLVATQARRAATRAEPVVPPPRPWTRFLARFPYQETEDQQRAVDDVLADLASGRLMDRLVIGDVGFGKTEVLLRAAFVIAQSARQVAVVAPTLPLARQHFREFQARFSGFGITVAEATRGGEDAEAVRKAAAEGKARIVIGTHALLDLDFADLGLLIVDEEQRFGVDQKEKLKRVAEGVHVLTASATPIPRTLQIAMAGLRDLSVIATPPVARRPVRTRVLEFDEAAVREALLREQRRGGQSFYVCPRLSDLKTVAERLARLVPGLEIATAHGKMSPDELDAAVSGFAEGGADVLLATNIIESGLNIPTANTLVVHRADMFGLAQLYQLRGRVGRGGSRGICLLTTEPGAALKPEARRRLATVAELADPGSGFELASRDMELRGAGNLLGEKQSGHVRGVGAELFQELLRSAVAAAADGRPVEVPWAPRITLDLPVLIPDAYVPDLNERLALYRTIANLPDAAAADAFAQDLEERRGPLPPEARTLLVLPELKRLCREAQVEQLDIGPRGALITLRAAGGTQGEGFLAGRPEARRRPDGRISVTFAEAATGTARLPYLRRILNELAGAAFAEEPRRRAAS
ncbi:DEAD/DEAH box helicase [Arenibaculum pallidiluteum]|uniref:DEAD/DEAH box helicase n=1 Tax=Arenibaculum pallidiluteum TaxID=2812559 RepID=UPI001A956DEB|nr:DEAD/DEAH box helicase [Arenibaculum pallidiluteum]